MFGEDISELIMEQEDEEPSIANDFFCNGRRTKPFLSCAKQGGRLESVLLSFISKYKAIFLTEGYWF